MMIVFDLINVYCCLTLCYFAHMKNDLNWNDLRYFLEVARKGRLLSAAKSLGVNHTTVSRRLNSLEKSLQIKLFEQDEKGFHLTALGESILPLAQQIEDVTELTKEQVQLSGQTLSGNLRIGAPDGFGNSFLAERITKFTNENPDVSLKLVPVPLSHNLLKRDVDLAISLERSDRKDTLCKKITDYRLHLYTSRAYLERNSLDLTDVEQIKQQPFAGYIQDLLYTDQLDFNKLISKNLHETFQGATVMSQHQFIVGGGGFGVLPYFMVQNDDRFVRVLPEKFTFTRTYWLLIPVELTRLASVRALESVINELVRENMPLFLPD